MPLLKHEQPPPSQEQIAELRKLILEKIDAAGENTVHPKDLERVKSDDDWLIRFFWHHEMNLQLALQMMWSTLEWRKEMAVSDITEQNIKMDIIIGGGFFPRGKDVDGCPLFIFKCKKYVKNQFDMNELKRCVIYWMERLEREGNGNLITLFFDMEGCGLANMDLDFTKYLIGLFKDYYPYFLNYVLVFEMPWVLSAAFKIIKSWLPEKAVKKIKFTSKKDLKDWVPMDQALTCWGGEDDYTFSFVPENSVEDGSINNNRKVRFEDGTEMSDVGSAVTSVGGDGGLLTVRPEGHLKFTKEQDNELICNLTLKNISSTPISYKVKTTSPEKFRVRPGYGCLNPGSQSVVTVSILPAYRASNVAKDKFLILSTVVDSADLSSEELTDLWKKIAVKKEHQIHLRCSPFNENVKNGSILHVASDSELQLTQIKSSLEETVKDLRELLKSIRQISYLVFALIAILIAIILYLLNLQNSQKTPEAGGEPVK